jgi:hypothetical protein
MSIGKSAKAQTNKARQLVYDRDQHRCIVFGDRWQSINPCAGGLTIQHAVARGMGSSAKYNDVDSLRTMCAFHNALDASSAKFHRWALRNGWSVHRWMADRYGWMVIPVHYVDGWFVLHGGERHPITSDVALEAVEQLHGPDFLTFESVVK